MIGGPVVWEAPIRPQRDEQTVSARKLAATTDPRHSVGMTPLAWLVGFLLPACAASGRRGLPAPQLMDMSHIQRPASPNTALAGPAGSEPAPDIVTPIFPVPASRLYAGVDHHGRRAAPHLPGRRVSGGAAGPFGRPQRRVQFSRPDHRSGQRGGRGPAALLVLYSRSVYGYSDLGVNRQRLDAWLAALRARFNHPDER